MQPQGCAGHGAQRSQRCSPAAPTPVTWLTMDTLSLTSATKVALRDSLALQGDPCCLLWKPLNQRQKVVINNCEGNLRGKGVGDKQQGRKYSQWPCFREPGRLRKPHKPGNKETEGKKKPDVGLGVGLDSSTGRRRLGCGWTKEGSICWTVCYAEQSQQDLPGQVLGAASLLAAHPVRMCGPSPTSPTMGGHGERPGRLSTLKTHSPLPCGGQSSAWHLWDAGKEGRDPAP